MSSHDIQIICELLLGITNTDKKIRNISVNKLLELNSNKFDFLLFNLLEIIEKTSKSIDDKQKLLKTTSLVICRKIIENAEYNTLKSINKDLKLQIKTKLLTILNNEISVKDNLKVCDLIIELFEKIFEGRGVWPEIINLILSIYNYEPNEGDKNSLQIISLLYIIKGGINFLYKRLSINLSKFLYYLEKIFNSSNIDVKAKLLAGELVYELIYFANSSELEKFKPLIKNILISLYNSYQLFETNNQNEKDVKSFLKIFIDIESIEPSLLEIYFNDIFNLEIKIISNQKFEDQKIREMGFELIISLIEDKPSLIISSHNRDQILLSFFELILSYALEFDKNIELNLDDNCVNINIQNFDIILEDEILFSLSLLERLFESLKNDYFDNIFKLIVDNFIQKSWKFQYIILFALNTYCCYNNDISFVQQFFDPIFNLSFSKENKIRFASIYCIKNFIKILSQNF